MAQPRTLTVMVEPQAEPLTTAEAKSHLRVDIDTEDTLIASYVKAAREWVEDTGALACITQTLAMRLDFFPGMRGCDPDRVDRHWSDRYAIELPRAPVASVSSIAYVDAAGATQTLSSTLYQVSLGGRRLPARILPAYGQTWPVTRDQMDAVVVTFVAGYGAAGSAVPEAIRHLMRLLVAHQYEMREPVVTGTIVNELPLGVRSLLSQVSVPVAA